MQVGPLQEMRLLTNFKMDSFDPFIMVLCGQSDMRRVMDYAILESLSQRLALRYHMAPLDKEETHAYVAHHLNIAGANEPLFEPAALDALHSISFGIPRKIGAYAEQALTHAMFSGKRVVTADIVIKIKKLSH